MEEKTYKLLGGSGAAGAPGQTDFLRMQEMEFLRSSRLQIGNCVSEAFRKGDRRAQALHFYR